MNVLAKMSACQRVPSGASIGDSTNICGLESENELSFESSAYNLYARSHEALAQNSSLNYYSLTVPIYYNDIFIGNISLDKRLSDAKYVLHSDDEVELDFYILRYHEVVNHYLVSNERKVSNTIRRYNRDRSSMCLQWEHNAMKGNESIRIGNSKQFPSRQETLMGVKSKTNKSNLQNERSGSPTGGPLFQSLPNQAVTKSSINKRNKDEYTLQCVWLRRCITAYLPNLRQLYNQYSSLIDSKDHLESNEPQMNRLKFWQLLRDHGLHKRFDSLVALETLIWQNPYVRQVSNQCIFFEKTKVDDLSGGSALDPFQIVCFSQFVHSLLEMSWVLYSGQRATQNTPWPTHLTGCLCRLVTETLATQTEEGKALRNVRYSSLIPAVYSYFDKIGNPLPLRKFLSLLHDFQPNDDAFSMSKLCRLIHESDNYESLSKNKSDVFRTNVNGCKFGISDVLGKCNVNRAHCNRSYSLNDNSTVGSCANVLRNSSISIATKSKIENLSSSSFNSLSDFTSFQRPDLNRTCSLLDSLSNKGIKMSHKDQEDKEKILSMDLPKHFLILSMQEILNTVAQICPKILSGGTLVNINLHLNFLEYYEALILICELNASKTRRVAKLQASGRFYKEIIKPVLEEDRLNVNRQKVATRGSSKKKGPSRRNK